MPGDRMAFGVSVVDTEITEGSVAFPTSTERSRVASARIDSLLKRRQAPDEVVI